jgi:circadian clock protein KaiC
LSTGVAGLDQMSGGGLARTTSTAVVGPMGIGKTIAGMHFLSGCSAEEPGLFFGLHELPEALHAQARDLGLPLAEFIDQDVVEVIWQPTTEGVLDEVCARLLDAVRRRGVRRLFIDGIDGFTQIAADNDRVSHVVTALSNELRSLGVTSLWTAQVDVGNSLGATPLSGIALQGLSSVLENVILMRHVEVRSQLYRTVTVLKARVSRIERTLRCFNITERGIVIDDTPGRAEAVLAELSPGTGRALPPAVAVAGDEA